MKRLASRILKVPLKLNKKTDDPGFRRAKDPSRC